MRQLARRRGFHQPVSSGIIILARVYYAARDRKRAPAARIETKLHRNLSLLCAAESHPIKFPGSFGNGLTLRAFIAVAHPPIPLGTLGELHFL